MLKCFIKRKNKESQQDASKRNLPPRWEKAMIAERHNAEVGTQPFVKKHKKETNKEIAKYKQ